MMASLLSVERELWMIHQISLFHLPDGVLWRGVHSEKTVAICIYKNCSSFWSWWLTRWEEVVTSFQQRESRRKREKSNTAYANQPKSLKARKFQQPKCSSVIYLWRQMAFATAKTKLPHLSSSLDISSVLGWLTILAVCCILLGWYISKAKWTLRDSKGLQVTPEDFKKLWKTILFKAAAKS